ncbi:MAG TPA: hypothetical protein VM925_23825 [Labilithrix sp.]|nr:hypothetical protein [Labilithrix sp.]
MKRPVVAHARGGAWLAASSAGRARRALLSNAQEIFMKYGLAWLLGVPPVLIVGWFLLNHC